MKIVLNEEINEKKRRDFDEYNSYEILQLN